MTRLLLIALMLVSCAASARMYQWQDPQSRSMQLSGVPPAWYRSPEGGPRVRVYEGGRLVDDTYIQLSDEQSATMRELAFKALQEERQVLAIKRLERAARVEESRREQERRAAEREQAAKAKSSTDQAPPDVLPESLDPEQVRRLKEIIAEFDRTNGPGVSEIAPQSAPSEAQGGTSSY